MSDTFASMQPPVKPPRKRKATTLRDADWQPHKERITELFDSGITLDELKHVMEAELDFLAEIRQYKSQMKKWGLGRNVTSREMKAIVRKRQQRKILEPSRPELVFKVRAAEVNAEKIERWMNRHNVQESELYAPSPAASTPSVIDCHTNYDPSTPKESQATQSTTGRTLDFELRLFEQGISPGIGSIIPSVRTLNDRYIWEIWKQFFLHIHQFTHQIAVFALCRDLVRKYLDGMIGLAYTGSPYLGGPRDLWLIPIIVGNNISDSLLDSVMEYWVEIGVTMESRYISGRTTLLWACSFGFHLYVSLLIKHGANVHAVDDDGSGALYLALLQLRSCIDYHPSRSKDIKAMILELLDAGCDPQATDYYGKTPLQCLVQGSSIWYFWTDLLLQRARGVQHDLSPPHPIEESNVIISDPTPWTEADIMSMDWLSS